MDLEESGFQMMMMYGADPTKTYWLSEIKKHQPDDPQVLNKIGLCLIRLEKYPSAAQHFEQALELDLEDV